jgi:ABC-type phosphate transport system substrate-binding protein
MRTKCSMTALLAAGTSVAAMVLSGVGASSAFACTGTPIVGQGSSLQKIAQENVWIPDSGFCVTYSSTSSGSGRTAWGVEKAGNKPGNAGEAPNTSGDTYIASDEPLSSTQLSNLDEAAGAGVKGTGQALVIPTVQAAVAVIVNPPEGCTIEVISNEKLQKVWNGTVTKWSEIAGGGEACKGSITRVVRRDSSGTTFVFKEYMQRISNVATCNGKKWKVLAEPANNLVWPENGQTGCTGLSTVVVAAKTGGGGEVEQVINSAGSIGYANLGDARAQYTGTNRYKWIKVENKTAAGAFPGVSSGGEPSTTKGEANCKETNYGNKTELETETGSPKADDNWTTISGLNTKSTTYPICTLTYDIAVVKYGAPGAEYGTTAKALAETTKKYLGYDVSTGALSGQAEVSKERDYDALPEPVQLLAAKLVEKITP